MPLLEAHDFVCALEAEILREVPEIDAVLTHIESEPATIEQPEETVEVDRRIEQAHARDGRRSCRRLWMCMRSWWAAPASTFISPAIARCPTT